MVSMSKTSYKNIWSTAWPVMGALSSYLIFQAVDMMWIGKLGKEALGGASVGAAFLLLIFMFSRTISTGSMSLISRAFGAKEEKTLKSVCGDTYVLSVGLGLLEVAIFLPLLPHIIPLFQLEPEVAHAAHEYMRVILFGAPLWYLTESGFAFFNGTGRTRTPMIVAFWACLINAVLDPLLLFGWYGFPKLGVAGAAWATVIASVFEAALVIYLHARAKGLGRPSFLLKRFYEIISIGLPSSIRDISFPLVDIIMFRVVAPYGSAAVAALGIAGRVTGLMVIYIVGLSIALASLAGQQIGAKLSHSVPQLLFRTIIIGSLFHLVVCIFIFAFPHTWLGLFVADTEVFDIGTPMLLILTVTMFPTLFVRSLSSIFQASGKTWVIFQAAILGQWLVHVPLAWYASSNRVDIRWIWLSFAAGRLVETMVLGYAYWKKQWCGTLAEVQKGG